MKRVAFLATIASAICPTYSFVVPSAVQNYNGNRIIRQHFGLLDDYLSEAQGDDIPSTTATAETSVQEYEDLFHSLIFSGDTRAGVAKKLDQCTDSNFAEYLETTFQQSQDDDEKQGLQELMDLIAQVVDEAKLKEEQEVEELKAKEAAKAKLRAELDQVAKEKAAPDAAANGQSMSPADVIKQANAIDGAVMTNVLSDDEKPSDFISDCREVVNLSRGFNDQGKMQVGGR